MSLLPSRQMNTGTIRYYHCARLWLAQSFYCEVSEADLLSNHLIAKAKHTIIDCGPQANGWEYSFQNKKARLGIRLATKAV